MRSNIFGTAIRYWNTPPSNLDKSHHRSFVAFSYGFPTALIAHLFFVVVFWICGVHFLFFLNLASVAIWTIAIYLVRKGKIFTAAAIGVGEFIVHQILAVAIVGWSSEFQIFLLFPPMVFLGPPGNFFLKVSLTTASTIALSFCYF